MEFTIRRAESSDFEAMRDISHAALREIAVSAYPLDEITEAIETGAWTMNAGLIEDGSYFVAERSGELLGGVGWDEEWLGPADTPIDRPPRFASLRSMFVAPRCAGKGIGNALLKHCLEDIEQQAIPVTELYASFNAEKLYSRHGFKAIAIQSLPLASGAVMKGSRMRRRNRLAGAA